MQINANYIYMLLTHLYAFNAHCM